MSKRIQYLTEVVEEVLAERARSRSFTHDIPELRRGAVHAVAERHGVEPETVADAFIRQLRPHIGSASEFDTVLEQFVRGEAGELIEALSHHLVDWEDRGRVKRLVEQLDEHRRP